MYELTPKNSYLKLAGLFRKINTRLNKQSYNLRQNICRLFHVLAQFFFTTSETGLDFITRNWMLELPHDLPKIYNFRKTRNYKKIPEMTGFGGK